MSRLQPGEASFNTVLRGYKRRAWEKGFEFTFSTEEFRNYIGRECYYCGAEPSNLSKSKYEQSGDLAYNGLDRLLPEFGYTPENCVPCCKDCNLAKRSMNHEEFVNLARAIAEKHKNNLYF
jgi:hypothetical protein